MRFKKRLAVPAVVLLLFCGVIAACYVLSCDRIVFTVENQNRVPISDVVVMVRDAAYPVGDMDAGGRGRVVARTLPECSPRLRYGMGGARYDVDIDSYLCNAMRGTISIVVKENELAVKESIRLGFGIGRPVTADHVVPAGGAPKTGS